MKRLLCAALLATGLAYPVVPARAAADTVITSLPYHEAFSLADARNGISGGCVGATTAATAAGGKSWTLQLDQPASVEAVVSGRTSTDPAISLEVDDAQGRVSCGNRTSVRAHRTYTISVIWYDETGGPGPGALTLDVRRSAPTGVGVVRDGRWYLAPRPGAGANQAFSFGSSTDVPVVIAGRPWVRRGARWFPKGGHSFSYGIPSDAPVVADWDGRTSSGSYGEGSYDDPRVGVVSRGAWSISSTRSFTTEGTAPTTQRFSLGGQGDVFLTGDWDGDNAQTPAVFRRGRWYFSSTVGGPATSACSFGDPSDVPVVGDWDGDGIESPGVFRAGRWYTIDRCGGPVRAFTLGGPGDEPVVGRWPRIG